MKKITQQSKKRHVREERVRREFYFYMIGAETVEMIVFPFWKKKGLVSIAYTNINNTINTSFFPIFFFFPLAPAPSEEIKFLVLCFFSGWCLIESMNHRIEKVGCLCCFGGIG